MGILKWFSDPGPTVEQAFERGTSALQEEDWAAARKWFQQAIELDPDVAASWYCLAMACSKIVPEDFSDDEARSAVREMCGYFERAMDLGDRLGGLEARHYCNASLCTGTAYKVENDLPKAIRSFRRGLAKNPDDLELIDCLAACLAEVGDADVDENLVEHWLQLNPASVPLGKLWKKLRKQAGKPLSVDLPEENRQEIYYRYTEIQEDVLLSGSLLKEQIQACSPVGIQKAFYKQSQMADEEATNRIMNDYGLSAFQVDLIVQEGKRNAWPFCSVLQNRSEAAPVERFRDSLRCAYCEKRNAAPYWPRQGDYVGFYYQTEERTREVPGAFRVPITCPFCHKTCFAVWDEEPDQLAGLLLLPLEHIGEAWHGNPQAIAVVRGLICDEILGKHVEFVEGGYQQALQERRPLEQSVIAGDYSSTITIVPALVPDAVRASLGGSYLNYLNGVFSKADLDAQHTVNWIFCDDGQQQCVHWTFIPRRPDMPHIPFVISGDMLTPEEDAQLSSVVARRFELE